MFFVHVDFYHLYLGRYTFLSHSTLVCYFDPWIWHMFNTIKRQQSQRYVGTYKINLRKDVGENFHTHLYCIGTSINKSPLLGE